MAKQILKGGVVESYTVDFVGDALAVPVEPGVAKPRRGRPPTGKAKTPAQRQKERRARLAAQGLASVTLVLPVASVLGLKQFVRFKDVTPGAVVGKLITTQLLRKRNGSR